MHKIKNLFLILTAVAVIMLSGCGKSSNEKPVDIDTQEIQDVEIKCEEFFIISVSADNEIHFARLVEPFIFSYSEYSINFGFSKLQKTNSPEEYHLFANANDKIFETLAPRIVSFRDGEKLSVYNVNADVTSREKRGVANFTNSLSIVLGVAHNDSDFGLGIKDLEKLKSKEIETIRFFGSGDSNIDLNFTEEQSKEFMKLLKCLVSVELK